MSWARWCGNTYPCRPLTLSAEQRPMSSLFQPWYAPAEPAVSARSVAHAILPGIDDFVVVLKEYLGVDHCVLGSSGRALLCRLLTALRRKAGHERVRVLIPGYTCYSVAASVARAGLEVACYDLDPQTLLPDMDSVRAMAGQDTLAVVGQHLFGIATPMEGLRSVAHGVGARLVEDAAQGLGGAGEGSTLGTMGDFGVFSFGRGKPLPLGGGGALVGSAEVMEATFPGSIPSGCLDLARAAASGLLSHRRVYGLLEALPLGLGETVFDPGFAMEPMSRALQGLGTCSLRELRSLNAHRNATASIYREVLGGTGGSIDPRPGEAVYTRYPFMAGDNPIPEALRRLGVRRMYPRAILDEPAIAPYRAAHTLPTPGASRIAQMLVTLPTHRGIDRELARTIAVAVKDAYSW